MSGRRGLLFVISGPSAVGKDELVNRLLPRDPKLRYSISFTTRPKRDYEVDGVHYNFVERDEFERMISANDFLEYAEYNGNLYGTSREWVTKTMGDGFDVILKIEVQGAEKVRRQRPDGISIFIAPPSLEELERRRAARGHVDNPEQRQRIAVEEMKQAALYDHVVVNDDLEKAVDDLQSVIAKERARKCP